MAAKGQDMQMCVHGKMLVLKRAWTQLANIARRCRFPGGAEWPVEMKTLIDTLAVKHRDAGPGVPEMPVLSPSHSWSRVVVAANLVASEIDKTARDIGSSARTKHRRHLRDEISGVNGYALACRLLRDPPP
eukprot:11550501-Alexandrium_andersonii.AAC.1